MDGFRGMRKVDKHSGRTLAALRKNFVSPATGPVSTITVIFQDVERTYCACVLTNNVCQLGYELRMRIERLALVSLKINNHVSHFLNPIYLRLQECEFGS